jgi:hypothetical protein
MAFIPPLQTIPHLLNELTEKFPFKMPTLSLPLHIQFPNDNRSILLSNDRLPQTVHMSASKIAEILEQGVGINISLGEDQLNHILQTMCEIITTQSDQIADLRISVASLAGQYEVNTAIARLDTQITELTLNLST